MKNLTKLSLALLTASLFTTTAQAETGAQKIQKSIQEGAPAVVLQVLDTSGKEPKVMDGNRLSRSKPRSLCVVALNTKSEEQNMFVQYIQAPSKMLLNIEHPKVQVQVEPNQGDNPKNYLVVTTLDKNEPATFCWNMDKKYPIGEYKLDVQFNEIVFKGLKFTVLK